jgi:hypothetical protein
MPVTLSEVRDTIAYDDVKQASQGAWINVTAKEVVALAKKNAGRPEREGLRQPQSKMTICSF